MLLDRDPEGVAVQLYSFFNSSMSYRVRIALALKGLDFSYGPVNIRTGAHRDARYVAEINPSAAVPALVDGEFRLGQPLAIIQNLCRRPRRRPICLSVADGVNPLMLATADWPNESRPFAF